MLQATSLERYNIEDVIPYVTVVDLEAWMELCDELVIKIMLSLDGGLWRLFA